MKTKNDFKNLLSGVAITALLSRKIDSFKKLSNYTEYEISALVGIGPSSIKLLKKGLAENKLSFKKNDSNFKISNSVEQYIAQFPEDLQKILMKIRAIILKEAKGSIELISYGIPAYKYDNKPLIYFAAYTRHIGLYATPSGHSAFRKELSKYKQGKGSVQFLLNEPIPYDLIKRMVQFRISEL